MSYEIHPTGIEPIVDGMIDLLRVNLVASTFLTQDAHVGDTVLHVDNAIRFRKFDYILLMDNNAKQDSTSGVLHGAEFHGVAKNFQGTGLLHLSEPLQKDFLVSEYGRLQKTIKKAILYRKDVLYGDRKVINFDYVAICVEPENKSQDWLAVRLLGTEIKMSILVYVKAGGTSDEEEYAMRVCGAYADAINTLLMSNLHLDISIGEANIVRDARVGDTGVYIDCAVADDWVPDDECMVYEVQDNYGADLFTHVVETGYAAFSSSSSSVSSMTSSAISNNSSSQTATSLSSSTMISSLRSESSSSSESWSSQSGWLEETSTLTSVSNSTSSATSESSLGDNICWVELAAPLTRDFLVQDKAVIRKKKRYMYDSRVDNIEYGLAQKGSVLMKAAKISWFGKEAESFTFPQVGLGRQDENRKGI